MRYAVIDLGTNTCNLLVADVGNEDYKILHRSKQHVKLGSAKTGLKKIDNAAIDRIVGAFGIHKNIIENFNVDKIKVIATSAVRSAVNKIDVLDKIGEETGWAVKVISGEKEAELIFGGVLLAFDGLEKPSFILDIGGGSNEIIIAKEKKILWKESRPAGMARVLNRFPISDPITLSEINILRNYFADEHKAAIEMCRKNRAHTLIGCSGAFDTIADIIDKTAPGEKQRKAQPITIDNFKAVYNLLIKSNRDERITIKGMDTVRVDLIVPGIILIEMLIMETEVNKIVQTDYALSEGVLYESISKNRQSNSYL